MYIPVDVTTDVEIRSLSDLPKLKQLMGSLDMKINKSRLAREMKVDRRTIDKYLNGYVAKNTRNKSSVVDEYYDIIKELLSKESKQVFYYKRVLWQYLTDNHGLKCSQSAFRAYILRHPEFQAYFSGGKRATAAKQVIRYETTPGEQAQFDWKENIRYVSSDGEMIHVNVGVFLLSYSRFRMFTVTLSKSQSVLHSFLTECFEKIGGVPKVLVTDNMKTVMDVPRTQHQKGIVNERFDQFMKDFGCTHHPCIAGRPYTKGKVETPMKLLDEIHAYQGKFTYEELHQFVQDLCNRINHSLHQGTRKIPVLMLKQEKNLLLPLPRTEIRDSHKILHTQVKVNQSSMVTYRSNQYSVPPEYRGKTVQIQVYDKHLYVYYNMVLLVEHRITSSTLNYKQEHYVETLSKGLPDHKNIEELAKKNLAAIGEVYKNEY